MVSRFLLDKGLRYKRLSTAMTSLDLICDLFLIYQLFVAYDEVYSVKQLWWFTTLEKEERSLETLWIDS